MQKIIIFIKRKKNNAELHYQDLKEYTQGIKYQIIQVEFS